MILHIVAEPEVEQIATEILSDALLKETRCDVTVLMASIIVDFESYWKPLVGPAAKQSR
jgi:hypothetical protein